MGVASVRGERARRRDLREGRSRYEVEHPDARRGDPCVARQTTGRHQGRHRRPGGGRRRRLRDVPDDPSRALRCGRDGDRGHGKRQARRPHAHDCAARDDGRDRRGEDARRPEALRPVRRRCAGRVAHADSRAREHARRERRRRRRGPPPRAVDWRVVHRRRVPDAVGGTARRTVPGDGRARRAHLVRPRPDGDGPRRAPGRKSGQCGRALCARQGERTAPPRAGPARGTGGTRPPLRGPSAVRRVARRPHGRDRERLRREHGRPRLCSCPRRARGRLGR